ncbi:sedoheptulokinase isoform X2 [Hippocampus zosterae]|uniref:sedoheptulokinase isoform X2 n=1 Tax=Hippocampus zosterae TaxID=109293 RepID=UPI00223D2B6B|nr:sedoheptulokinase isoform X2 [Hippocampus zosterae]
MHSYILGLDVGTTSIKAVLLESDSKSVAASQSLATASDIADTNGIKAKEQDTARILDTLNRCVGLLSKDKLQHVCSIGVSGQMHGVLFWNAKSGCDWSRGDLSQLITWQDGRCSNSFLSSLPKPNSHLSVATGFGCATIFWYMKHRPEFLKDFTVAGTIQDYVVSMLCGLDRCLMTPQNAASWGFYNTSAGQWNVDILNGAGFPLHLLPQCVPSGELAGHTRSDWHGIPAGTPVGAALGDFQCAVYSCLSAQTDAGVELSEQSLYEKMIGCALEQESSDLTVSPTILGERHDPFALAKVTNISACNLSLGHVTRALCRGILENLASMMPPERLRQAGIKSIVGSGSALARNEVLRQEVERVFSQSVVYGQNADSAVGVALVLCDRLGSTDGASPVVK